MKLILPILLMMMFSCSSTKPVDISNLVSREGLVYYNKTSALFSGEGINLEKLHLVENVYGIILLENYKEKEPLKKVCLFRVHI